MGVDSSLTGYPDVSTLEVVKEGTISVTATGSGSGGTGTTTITHNLGYKPEIMASLNLSGETWIPLPYTNFSTGASSLVPVQDVRITNNTSTFTDVVLSVIGSQSATYDVSYRLLRRRAN